MLNISNLFSFIHFPFCHFQSEFNQFVSIHPHSFLAADCSYLYLSHSELFDFMKTTLSPGFSNVTAGTLTGTWGSAGAEAVGLDSTLWIICSRFLSLLSLILLCRLQHHLKTKKNKTRSIMMLKISAMGIALVVFSLKFSSPTFVLDCDCFAGLGRSTFLLFVRFLKNN